MQFYDQGVRVLRQVTIPQMTEIDITFEGSVALEVTIKDPKGRLALAGFRTGDRIVAIDGETFSDRKSVEARLAAARPRDRATLTVMRGDKELQIEYDVKELEGRVGGKVEMVRD